MVSKNLKKHQQSQARLPVVATQASHYLLFFQMNISKLHSVQEELEKSLNRERLLKENLQELSLKCEIDIARLMQELKESRDKLDKAERQLEEARDSNVEYSDRLEQLQNDSEKLKISLKQERATSKKLSGERSELRIKIEKLLQAEEKVNNVQHRYERLCDEILYYIQISAPTKKYEASRIHHLIDLAIQSNCSIGFNDRVNKP
jgi:chromosome segregation ATPase